VDSELAVSYRLAQTVPTIFIRLSWSCMVGPIRTPLQNSALRPLWEGDEMSWQPIETAPRDGRWILVHGLDCDGRGSYWPASGFARWDVTKPGGEWETKIVAYVTGWQPIPEPPMRTAVQGDGR
jgi:hypothetical protein